MVTELIKQLHEHLGHSGIRKTEAALRQRYWWPRMHNDILQFCTSCDTCAQTKSPPNRPCAPLQPMIAETPNQRIGIDIIGPLPLSRKGKRYILVMVDYFTKWCEAIPIAQQDATSVARVFVDKWISRYGVPRQIHSDQGAHKVTKLHCRAT